jgi:hypothetical protein
MGQKTLAASGRFGARRFPVAATVAVRRWQGGISMIIASSC